MKRLCLALALAVLLLLVAGVGTAAADPGEPEAIPELSRPADGPAQQEATDAAAPMPDLGSLEQANAATSSGTAGNANAAKQDADQDQGSSGTQVIGQSAKSEQDALALALTVQKGASNVNAPVSVLSEGDSGDVSQENTATSDATSGNLNLTGQDADQEQSGDDCKCKHGDGGTQVIGQSAKSEQDAAALAKTVQEKPSNTNVSIRVLSPGDSGSVTQANNASSTATAGNVNLTKQDADQEQSGDDCKCSDGGTQVIGQAADSEQKAAAAAATVQEKPSNRNISIRVLSDGDDGNVTQTNSASSNATAGNVNLTKQDADQEQAGSGFQFVGQTAENDQKATALAGTVQEKPSNTNISIRVLSPGDGGNVTQSNTASSNATAGNLNALKQDADQEQGGHDCKCGDGKQVIGQSAKSEQDATALATTFQLKPSNTNTSIRVLSKGDDGDVTQSNTATSNATAGNLNLTKQDADQKQGGHDCKCGDGTQVIGQSAKSEQDATALAATFQLKPSNTNAPIRVLSKGDDGDVTQTNTATSNATAANLNLTKQDADQKQGGGSGIQVIGQAAKNDQDAKALAATFQLGASNENAPTRVLSKGDGGDVTQSNTASSDATALNVNWLSQDAEQWQGGKSRHDDKGPYDEGRYDDDGRHDDKGDCCGGGIQVIGQHADSDQDAKAAALTVQAGIKRPCTCSHEPSFGNSNRPVLVGSKGDGGDVTQSNTATSDADAFNLNATKQSARQAQATPCKCWEAFGIQVIGQLADSDQDATAAAATFQIGASNTSAPVSTGKGGRDHKDGHRSDGPVRE